MSENLKLKIKKLNIMKPSFLSILFGIAYAPGILIMKRLFFTVNYADRNGLIILSIIFAIIYFGIIFFFSQMLKESQDTPLFIMMALVIGAVLAIRVGFLDFKSGDYILYLSDWMNHLRFYPGFSSLGQNIGDYNLPYIYILFVLSRINLPDLYLIKIVSIIFDVVLGIYGLKLVGLKYKSNWIQLGAFIGIFITPTVILNSSAWSQCDSIWAAFTLAALYYMLKNKSITAVILWTIGFSFKMQAIFFAPVILLFVLLKRVKVAHLFLIIPVFFAWFIPALLAGRSFVNMLGIYFRQVGTSRALSVNGPTFTNFFEQSLTPAEEGLFGLIAPVSIFLAGTILLILLCYTYAVKDKLGTGEIIHVSLLMNVAVIFFLPQMHERFFYLADILAIIYGFYYPKKWYIPLSLIIISMLTYGNYLFRDTSNVLNVGQLTLLMFVIIFILAKDFYLSTKPSIEIREGWSDTQDKSVK